MVNDVHFSDCPNFLYSEPLPNLILSRASRVKEVEVFSASWPFLAECVVGGLD
jgi:hypothetical protein